MARPKQRTRRKQSAHPRGVLNVHASGYGFVPTAEGEFFIPERAMNGAFDGDLVEVAPASSGPHARKGRKGNSRQGDDKPQARVLRVLDRAHDTLVGRYEVAEPFGVVVPDDPRIPYDIFTMRADAPDVPDGALVRVRIAQFPTRHSAATGVVEEVLGQAGDGTLGVDVIIARHKLETRFSEAALAQAAEAALDAEGALAQGYRDIRDRFAFTIDPADAKDFDDALSIDFVFADALEAPLLASFGDSDAFADFKKGKRGLWRLGVHIADVSHYVPWGSSIDLEARRRATSAYLVDRVLPMLPPALSDELCSLKPGEDRRCMTVDMYLDDSAQVVAYDAYPALMRSRARLSYDDAQAVLDGANPPVSGEGDALEQRIRQCDAIAKKLAAFRRSQGSIDFASTEAKVRLDADGKPLAIVLRTKTDATELIEQAMILANETVARHLAGQEWPCLYRVHEKPSADALAALVPVFQEFPWFTEAMHAHLIMGNPHTIQGILAATAGRPEHELVSSLLLRAMKRAVYKPVNDGHYGLGLSAYCHFTSPIRRYPDLVVHRMLRAALTKRSGCFDQEVQALPWLAEHSSEMERIADAAARESQELKMIEYLAPSVGQTFPGIVSGVSVHGLYVRLECTAEGFLPIRALGAEYFAFDPDRYTLVGEETGKAYRLGQRIAVMLKAADPLTRTLEFRLC